MVSQRQKRRLGIGRDEPICELETRVGLDSDVQIISDYYKSHEDGQGQGVEQAGHDTFEGAWSGERVYFIEAPNAASDRQDDCASGTDYYQWQAVWSKLDTDFIPSLPDDCGYEQGAQQG